jgi:thymidine phosphorylase
MAPQEIIRAKRDGRTLSDAEINFFIAGLISGAVTSEQAAAFAMAVFFRGMSRTECAALTRAMTRSGRVLDWRPVGLGGPMLDKHSTGGVGDNVSLMLAPMIAACGGFVPMISGRALGHTGGTLDKLESIPGYNVAPDEARFSRVVKNVGCAIIGQTEALAPADRRLYAIRDVTATVESIPLITASILSKKLAAGLDGLVMDVKTGNGAFMVGREDARALADSIICVAREAGLRAAALITDMNQPLASAAGNAVEVRNAIDFLTGAKRDQRLLAVTMALASALLRLGGLATDESDAHKKLTHALASGAAAERFAHMTTELGGPAALMERPDAYLPRAPIVRPVASIRSGHVRTIDTRAVGLAVAELGAGRTRPQDKVDHAVGMTDLREIGDRLEIGDSLGVVHARSADDWQRAATALIEAYEIAEKPEGGPPLIEAIQFEA